MERNYVIVTLCIEWGAVFPQEKGNLGGFPHLNAFD